MYLSFFWWDEWSNLPTIEAVTKHIIHIGRTPLSNFCVHCIYGLLYVNISLCVCIRGFYMLFHAIMVASIEEKILENSS